MITTTYHKEINLLTADLTKEVISEDVFLLTEAIQNKEINNSTLRILIHAKCHKTTINPAQIFWWAEKYAHIFERFANTKMAIIATRPVFVALSQIFKHQYNISNFEMEVFSKIENAHKFLRIESYSYK